jgi:beta-galactosidase
MYKFNVFYKNRITMKLFRKFCIGLIFLMVLSKAFSQTYTINSEWGFLQDDAPEVTEVIQSDGWKKINLPHTWNRDDVIDDERGYKQGVGWYRKNMVLKSGDKNNLFVKFEGVNQVAEVFINGEKAGEHAGGYTAFVVDITPFVNFDNDNEILVKVDNSYNPDIPPLSADFTFFGGIYRDVWLIRKGDVHFDLLDKSTKGIYLSTPEVSSSKSLLKTTANLRNVANEKHDLEYGIKVFDPNNKLIATEQETVRIKKGKTESVEISFEINAPELWSPATPQLYGIEFSLYNSDGSLADQTMFRKGFRWVEMNENRGLLLNGEPVKLIGANRHQDFEGLGNALPDELHRKDIQLLKDMGANFIRIAHYPQDPAILEACDELGLLVWEEIPIVNYITVSEGFKIVSETMLTEMIRQHYNHTSIIMWGFMNEVLLQLNKGLERNPQFEREVYLQKVNELTKALHKLAKQEDSSRWTAIAHHANYDVYEEAGLNDVTDIVGWNLYNGWYSGNMAGAGNFLDQFHADHPDKGIIIAEYGGGSDPRIRALEPRRFDFSIEWQTAIHVSYYQQMVDRPHVMGGAIWNYADFSSEGRKDAVPQINSKGIVNYDRSFKDSYLYYQAALSNVPYLKIGSLDWLSREGFANERGRLNHPVFIFTNADKIEVLLNSESLGTFDVDNFHLKIMVPFEDGKNSLLVKTEDNMSNEASFDVNIYPSDLRVLPPEEIDISMNVGAHFYFTDDVTGKIWLPERPYRKGGIGFVDGTKLMTWGGIRVGTDVRIHGSGNEPVYQTHRDSISSFRADVPDGWYEVTLSFAEIYSEEIREKLANNLGADSDELYMHVERAFEVKVNGNDILTVANLEDFRATDYKFRVKATRNKGLEFEFDAMRSSAFISAVSIRGL